MTQFVFMPRAPEAGMTHFGGTVLGAPVLTCRICATTFPAWISIEDLQAHGWQHVFERPGRPVIGVTRVGV